MSSRQSEVLIQVAEIVACERMIELAREMFAANMLLRSVRAALRGRPGFRGDEVIAVRRCWLCGWNC